MLLVEANGSVTPSDSGYKVQTWIRMDIGRACGVGVGLH